MWAFRSAVAAGLKACTTLALLLVVASPSQAASLFDPLLRFRAMPTEHFVIYFHQGEDRLAQRLGMIAEETWHALQRPLDVTPPRRTRVVLADQTEVFNGYATPLPYDTIVIYTVAPSGSGLDFGDWLRVAFTHEFTHIVHLDRSEGWARVVRSIFGRTVYAFPNLFLPPWQVEGLATYEETVVTGEGRLHAGDFRAIVAEAARHGRLEPLDRVNGGLVDWPGGAGVYAYGVGFHQYLADRFGADRLAILAEATARRVPYLAAPAFKRVYGESLGDLWRDYESSLTTAATTPAADASITRLTKQGFSVTGPRFDRFACAGCPPSIVYSAVNPRGFPALYRIALDGGEPRQLATRYLGSTTAVGPDAIYFDQVEQRRNVGLYNDLYVWRRSDGRVQQLTMEARLQDPDLSPDGETLAAVQNHRGQRDLVLVTTAGLTARATDAVPTVPGAPRRGEREGGRPAITTLIAEPDAQFDTPRWSPDGRSIAVSRHRLGAMPEIVIVDVATKAARIVASGRATRYVMPAWRPDGRTIVAAAAAEDETFNLFEFAVDGSSARQLTNTTGGALWPDFSPDGTTIVFAGYTTDGYDLFSIPYSSPNAGWTAALPQSFTPAPAPVVQAFRPAIPETTTGYSPLDTLKPTSWTPVIETGGSQLRIGAGVSGYDVLGYHAYAAAATWLVSSPAGTPRTTAATPDWQVVYLYDRWRPTFYVAARSDTSFFAGPALDDGTPAPATRRERQFEGGVLFPIRHARAQHALQLSLARATADDNVAGTTFARDRTPLRAAWQTITAHTYGYSISREQGVAAGATAEIVRRAFASFADATTTTADMRAYLPGLGAHHVVAVRAGGGASIGDPTVGREFLLGGDSPGVSAADLDGTAFSLLRGFGANTFSGTHIAVVNAEYRWPLARPQRGYGTWPLFVQTVHAAIVADAGHAWTRSFQAREIKSSAGAQLSADVIAGFVAPFTATIGAAWGHDGSGRIPDGVTAYFRVGKGF
ncbi:MAG: repeat-containing protein [Acidobacteria bacterium]|nr:repeat-containing protein [Acidobacteriota bacterium]